MTRKIIPIIIILVILSACAPVTPLLADQVYQVNLPLVVSPAPPLFGVENEDTNYDALLADKYRGDFLAVSIHWGLVMRDGWDYVDAKVGSFDGPLMLKIKGAPEWVTLAETCRPIPVNSWGAYADFVRQSIMRYPNTFAVEFMNEPDTLSSWAEYYLGCWGTDYANGLYYGEFVTAVFSDLKPDYPGLTFIGGAFRRPDNEFTAGALSAMAADAASFHYYPWCDGPNSEYKYLYDTFTGKTDLPVWFSETGMLYADTAPANCPDEQADYILELFDYQGVEAVIYYTLGCRPDGHEWNNSSIWGEFIPRTLQLGQYGAKFLFDDCIRKAAVDAYNSIGE